MATKNEKDLQAEQELNVAETISDPNRTGTAATTPTGKKPRVKGRLAKPVYLIHSGKREVEVPAVTRDVVITDEEAENFGSVVEEVVVPSYKTSFQLPKHSRFGSRKIGVAHEIWDAEEAESLKARGFVAASDTEVKKAEKSGSSSLSTDQIAARERERAFANMKKHGGVARSNDAARDEE